ncbi:outer membrane beta-barrel protein [Catalinimonas niigatensis]|uniref:outer membrane beta-barrel protein n=1 Tax=Catalinimonas niigatensis TaxID=1397264 RepID=UPI002665861A|nr:outer membrane beta-barrel protein [Catalinimonas niigatensis]WPP50588.1 outer membrane beta-barrel protein [Catalinimonas niigatensis]
MKHILLLFFVTLAFNLGVSFAQGGKYGNHKSIFSSTQGFIGIWSGVNFSTPKISHSYSDFVLIAPEADILSDSKQYEGITTNLGSQMGLSAAFSFSKYLTIAFSPSYKTINYQYQSQFSWQDGENSNNYLELMYQHKQNLHYVSLPLLIRFSPAGKRFRPYLQAGGYYDRLLDAQKIVTTEGIDQASGGQVNFKEASQSTDISHLYIKSHTGILGGAGASYNLGTIIFYIDGQYRYGLHNIVSAKERFSGSRNIYGFGNVLDDLSIRNIEFSLGCYFPLKFLTKDFKPVIL